MSATDALISLVPFAACSGICLGIWKLFNTLEKVTKPIFTKRIADLIESPSSIFSLFTAIPGLFLSVFDAIFTDNLFSFRGFLRSARISRDCSGLTINSMVFD